MAIDGPISDETTAAAATQSATDAASAAKILEEANRKIDSQVKPPPITNTTAQPTYIEPAIKPGVDATAARKTALQQVDAQRETLLAEERNYLRGQGGIVTTGEGQIRLRDNARRIAILGKQKEILEIGNPSNDAERALVNSLSANLSSTADHLEKGMGSKIPEGYFPEAEGLPGGFTATREAFSGFTAPQKAAFSDEQKLKYLNLTGQGDSRSAAFLRGEKLGPRGPVGPYQARQDAVSAIQSGNVPESTVDKTYTRLFGDSAPDTMTLEEKGQKIVTALHSGEMSNDAVIGAYEQLGLGRSDSVSPSLDAAAKDASEVKGAAALAEQGKTAGTLSKVVYHGSPYSFEDFNQNVAGQVSHGVGNNTDAIFFTDNPHAASTYSGDGTAWKYNNDLPEGEGQVRMARLDLKNPLITSDTKWTGLISQNDIEELKTKGYDGVIYEPKTGGPKEYVVLDKNQIHSPWATSSVAGPGGETPIGETPKLPKVQLAGPRVAISEVDLPTEIPAPPATTAPQDIGKATYAADDNSIAAKIARGESLPTVNPSERIAITEDVLSPPTPASGEITQPWPEDWGEHNAQTPVSEPETSADGREVRTVGNSAPDNPVRKPGTTIITDDSPGVDRPSRINLGAGQPEEPSRTRVLGNGNEKTGSPAGTQTKVGALEKEWQDLADDKKFAQEKGLLQDEGFATELENRQKNLITRTRAAGVNVQDGQPDFKNTSGVDSKTAQLKSEWSDLEADKKFAKANGLTGNQSFAESMQQRQDNLVRRTRAAGVSVTDGQPDFGGSSSATSKGRLGSAVDTLKSKGANITTSLSDTGSKAKTAITNLAPDKLKGGGAGAAGSAEAAAGEASGRLGVLNGVAKVGKVVKVGGDILMAGYAGYKAGEAVYNTDKKAIHDLSHGNLNNLPKDIVAQVTLPGRAVGAVANAMVIEPGHKAITTEAAGGAYKTNVANQLVDMGDTHTPAKTLSALQKGLGPGWKEVDKKDGSSTFVRPLYDVKGKPAGTQTVEDVSFQMTQTGTGSPYQNPAKQKQVAADNKLTHKLFTPTTPGGMASVNSPASYLNPKSTVVNHAATTHLKTAAHTPSLAPPTTHQDQLGETNMKAAVGKTLSHPAEKTITIAVPHTVTTYKTVTDTRAVTPSSQHDDLMAKVRLGAGLQKAAQESSHVVKETKTYYTYETKTVPSTYVPSAPPAPPPPLEGFSSRPANWKTHTANDLEDRQTGQTVIIDGKSHNGVTVNTFKDGTITYQENGNTIGYGQPAGMKTTPTDTPNNLRQPAAGSSGKINFVSENGAGQATLKIEHKPKAPAAKTIPGVTNLKPTVASPGLSEHGLGQGNALPDAKVLSSAISGPPPEWSTTGVSSSLGGIGGNNITAHGNALAVRDSRDGKSLITQMQDGTYQAVNKTTGAVSGAGTWGDGAGGGVATNGIRNPVATVPKPASAQPSSTPSVAETIFPSATNGLAPKTAETVTTPAADNIFHPPSAATSAAKSNDMFSQAPAATPPPPSTIAETIFPTQNTPATSVADRLVLPPVNANDVKAGGAFAGLDIGNRAHGFGRQMDN